ncbi:Uncharacterized protein MSYG_1675 [Malassezia sympodialis ATCC 42132]|uniref:EamA domain-containing protein n=1 Tax=Malassezia sympodialis (strain ATCC 42132) TaxID=1230383 RepID=A0A1M8A562_MALS4|nr:Uncharacterized protein MSYG_1675 [Malassezia sympodialis ATCC 42132]
MTHGLRSMLSRLPGGVKSIGAFVLILFAYTLQTESMQHIQQKMGYTKPLFLLYLTHSSFVVLLPLQLGLMHMFSEYPTAHVMDLLRRDVNKQLRYYLGKHTAEPLSHLYLLATLGTLLVVLTVALTVPSISWFLAVPLTSMANITAIYNTFSLWALVLSVYFLHENWTYLQAMAVLLGILGVAMSAYGSTTRPAVRAEASSSTLHLSPALYGNALSLLGALSMAGYEVLYKRLTTIPYGSDGSFQRLPEEEDYAEESRIEAEQSLPFGVHAMAMMSGIGLATFLLFWFPLFMAHLTGFETFQMPDNWILVTWITISVLCGVIFNGCFAILLSLWGPVLASMSCLLTTVIVQLTDVLLGVPFSWLSMAGNLIITVSFLCLLPW